MKKIFTLFASALLVLSSFAQDPVLLFTGSGAGFTVNSSRNLTADTSYGRTNFYTFGTGISYGKWRGNRLLYAGLNFSISSSKDHPINNTSTAYAVGPVVGMMKRVNLGGPLHYMPFGEANIFYSNTSYRNVAGVESTGRGWTSSLSLSPLSFSLQATPKMDILFALGNVGAYYSSTRNPARFQQPETRYSAFSVNASLNTISLRLLLKI